MADEDAGSRSRLFERLLQLDRRLRRRVGPTPGTTDAINIALDQEKFDPAPDSSARILLGKQAMLVDADIRYRMFQAQSERVTVWLKRLTIIVGVLFGLSIAGLVISASRAHSVVVQAFDAPPRLAERGLSGTVIASGFQDALATIQGAVRTTAQRRAINNAWTGDIAVQVPQTGVSVGELDRLLRQKIGNETYIGGSVIQNADRSLSLTVRGSGIPPKTFTAAEAHLSGAIADAAEYIYGYSEPRLFAIYLFQKKRYREGEAFVSAAFARESDANRPELLVYWGMMLSGEQKYAAAANKTRLGVDQDPNLWRGWNSLLSSTRRNAGDEAGWQVGMQLLEAARRAPANNQPTALGLYNFQSLSQDWTGQIEKLQQDAKLTGGGGSFGILSASLLANSEVGRHGWRQALRYLDMADINDETILPQRLFTFGVYFLEHGRPDRAVPFLERLHRMWLGSAAFQYQFDYSPCYLGLAYGLSGNAAKAAPMWAVLRRNATCDAFQIETLEAQGDRAGADAAFASAIRSAPSLPILYQKWGAIQFHRGDLKRASAMFDNAQHQAPHWADPLKGQGDIRAARGDWAGALRKYEAAARYAPDWDFLRQATAVARRHIKPRGGLI